MQEGSGNNPQLYNAINANNINNVRQLVNNGVDLNQWAYIKRESILDRSFTPLEMAVYVGNIEIIEILLNTKPDSKNFKQYYFCTALIYAAYMGKSEIFDVIFDYFPGVDSTILDPSLKNVCEGTGNIKIAEKLIISGANVNILTDEGTPLMIASLSGNLEIVKLLVKNGANIDYTNIESEFYDSAVRLALQEEHWDIIEYLLPLVKKSSDKKFLKRAIEKRGNRRVG